MNGVERCATAQGRWGTARRIGKRVQAQPQPAQQITVRLHVDPGHWLAVQINVVGSDAAVAIGFGCQAPVAIQAVCRAALGFRGKGRAHWAILHLSRYKYRLGKALAMRIVGVSSHQAVPCVIDGSLPIHPRTDNALAGG